MTLARRSVAFPLWLPRTNPGLRHRCYAPHLTTNSGSHLADYATDDAASAAAAAAAAASAAAWHLEPSWREALSAELAEPYFEALVEYVETERLSHLVLPPAEQQLAAFTASPFERVKVVLIGQDPYPTPGDAHGMAFSVPPERAIPRSLCNLYAELDADVGVQPATHGDLSAWARQVYPIPPPPPPPPHMPTPLPYAAPPRV